MKVREELHRERYKGLNKQLIKQLKEERENLYPNGCPIQPRGCRKTFLYLFHFLIYSAYDCVCSIYENMDTEINLETAHKDIENYVEVMWKLCEGD